MELYCNQLGCVKFAVSLSGLPPLYECLVPDGAKNSLLILLFIECNYYISRLSYLSGSYFYLYFVFRIYLSFLYLPVINLYYFVLSWYRYLICAVVFSGNPPSYAYVNFGFLQCVLIVYYQFLFSMIFQKTAHTVQFSVFYLLPI